MDLKFSVLIVNYQSEDWLRPCLESLFKYHTNPDYEVIVVDNGSDPAKRKALQSGFLKIIWISNDDNLGFARGANQAAREARGRYLIFLNPDCRCTKEVFYSLLEEMGKNEQFGIGAPLLENKQGKILENGGGYPGFFEGIKKLTHLNLPVFKKSGQTSRFKIGIKKWISGACLAIRRKDFIDVGGWDERFFLYLEDVALCYNVQEKLKKNIGVMPLRGIIHDQSRSVQSDPLNELIWIERFRSWVTYLRYYKKEPEWIVRFFKKAVLLIERIKLILLNLKKSPDFNKREALFVKLREKIKGA